MRQLKPSKFVSAKKTTDHTHLPGNDYVCMYMFENKCAIYYHSTILVQIHTICAITRNVFRLCTIKSGHDHRPYCFLI